VKNEGAVRGSFFDGLIGTHRYRISFSYFIAVGFSQRAIRFDPFWALAQ
jgi:hypothetical protein